MKIYIGLLQMGKYSGVFLFIYYTNTFIIVNRFVLFLFCLLL